MKSLGPVRSRGLCAHIYSYILRFQSFSYRHRGCFAKPLCRGGFMKPLGALRGFSEALYRGTFSKLL